LALRRVLAPAHLILGFSEKKMNQSKQIFDETWGGKQKKLYVFVFPKEVPFNNPFIQSTNTYYGCR
jgi:hypothetical protein